MRRVVITGMGIVSPLGNNLEQVATALRGGQSGISFVEEYAKLGLRGRVAGVPQLGGLPMIERQVRRFMGQAAQYAYHALRLALNDSALTGTDVSHPRTGLVMGSGVGSVMDHVEALDILRSRGVEKIPPYIVPRVMGNTVSANLATAFQIKGVSYSIVSACATSAHCIGHAMELIQLGKQDRVIAGGAEEVSGSHAMMFDVMGALSSHFNDTPHKASRPYDSNRDGFVIAGGGGVLILEDLETAQKRGAKIYAELVGYGASSDGSDMVTPSHDGAARAMRLALDGVNSSIDYVNTHGTSTPIGDVAEVRAMRDVFGDNMPKFSSTKGLTGHPIAAAGVHEAIYSLLMMRDGFIAGSANVETLDPQVEGLPLVREAFDFRPHTIMSNSFGFGGTNASLVFQHYVR